MSLPKKQAKLLGSVQAWCLFKLVFPGSYLPIALLSTSLPKGLLFALMFFAVAWIPNYAHAYGYANEDGITFRRFFQKHRVTWDDVARVNWSNSNLLQQPYVFLTLEHPVGRFRTVKFVCFRDSSGSAQAQNPDWVPEILPWLMNQMRMNQPPTS